MTVAVLGIDWQTLADAVGLGAIYALMAVGIGLVFGVLRLVSHLQAVRCQEMIIVPILHGALLRPL